MPDRNLSKKRILVVDDEPMVCEAVGMMLNFIGHEFVAASSGQEALMLLNQGKFDLVITDFHMPGMNGGELVQAIKARTPAQPIIMITADADQLKSVADLMAGVDQMISKPFQFRELQDAVTKATAR